MNWYSEIWHHNTCAAILVHGVALIIILAAIEGLTFERKLFNLRTRNGRQD